MEEFLGKRCCLSNPLYHLVHKVSHQKWAQIFSPESPPHDAKDQFDRLLQKYAQSGCQSNTVLHDHVAFLASVDFERIKNSASSLETTSNLNWCIMQLAESLGYKRHNGGPEKA